MTLLLQQARCARISDKSSNKMVDLTTCSRLHFLSDITPDCIKNRDASPTLSPLSSPLRGQWCFSLVRANNYGKTIIWLKFVPECLYCDFLHRKRLVNSLLLSPMWILEQSLHFSTTCLTAVVVTFCRWTSNCIPSDFHTCGSIA